MSVVRQSSEAQHWESLPRAAALEMGRSWGEGFGGQKGGGSAGSRLQALGVGEGYCSPIEEIRALRSSEKPATGLCPSQERLLGLRGRGWGSGAEGQVYMCPQKRQSSRSRVGGKRPT